MSPSVKKPNHVAFEQAASVLCGTHGIAESSRQETDSAGQKVRDHGAAGGVGTFALQIAKSFGADVTGVCRTAKLDMVHVHRRKSSHCFGRQQQA
jgi:NADPH:quinone reductase-like Zn-dependent oxidoreductase